MASNGIKDRVAIVGMGCTPFGEHWDRSVEDMLVESSTAAYADAGIAQDDIDAFWFGTLGSGVSGLTLSRALKIDYKPVTRVENMCATGSEAFRNACLCRRLRRLRRGDAAVGVEKLKDNGMSGLTGVQHPRRRDQGPSHHRPRHRSPCWPRPTPRSTGSIQQEMKDVLTRIAWKNHFNGARNPRGPSSARRWARTRSANAPLMAGQLGIFDCSGVSDGSAAAILCRAEDAHKYTDNPLYVKALAFSAGPGAGPIGPEYDFTTFQEVVASATDAYEQAGVKDPREEISMAEVHDCFTATELVLMEDLGFSQRGQGWKDVLDGRFDGDGPQPVNPDGGLKSFGHPIGASGLRMMYEMWLQLRGEAGERQIRDPKLGLTHNLGGAPGRCVSFVSVVGK